MSEDEVNSVIGMWGVPVYFETDDTESGFWQFEETDMFVADSAGHLLRMGIDFLAIHADIESSTKGPSF